MAKLNEFDRSMERFERWCESREIDTEEATDAKSKKGSALITRCLADIKPEAIRWLWKDRIARGKITLLVGDPGLGKSLVTLALTAHVTTGAPYPVDGTRCELGDVVLLSAEDDAADTIRPRLDAAGADVGRVHIIDSVKAFDRDGKPVKRMVTLKEDLDAVRALLASLPAACLLIIDPISAYLGSTDSHNNAEVRGLFAPLAQLAAETGVAIVCVSHLNKAGAQAAIYRTMGSLAFVAAARSVYVVTKDKDDPTRRLVLPTKSNIAPDIGGLAYTVITGANGAPMVGWEPDPVTVSADEALSACADDGEQNGNRREREEAANWLREMLKNGRVASKELQRIARDDGIAWRTIRRAATEVGVETERQGFQGKTFWKLPIHGHTHKHGQVWENIGLEPAPDVPSSIVGQVFTSEQVCEQVWTDGTKKDPHAPDTDIEDFVL